MIGIQINKHFEDIIIGINGKIVGCSLNKLAIESIERIIIGDVAEPTIIETNNTDINTLNNYIQSSEAPNFAWSLVNEYLYLFIKPQYQLATVIIIGKRVGNPVMDDDSVIDVPEAYMELFTRYAIKEAAKLQGKIVPHSYELEIKTLENELKRQ